MLYTTTDTPIGELLLAGDGYALQVLHMQDAPKPRVIPDTWARRDRAFEQVQQQLSEYFDGRRSVFDVTLELHGSPFQLRVWNALREIPYGTTISYGELASRLGYSSPNGARAVGLANGSNPISVIVPCHRVIGSGGELTGYGGGLERKRLLLELEAGVLSLAL
jgi:methylated-DNA-[protein]-cysteine S-methyltransferase